MRGLRMTLAATAMLVPALAACGEAPKAEPAGVVAQFTDGTAAAAQARASVREKGVRDLEACRRVRAQGVDAHARRFPCEAFLGE